MICDECFEFTNDVEKINGNDYCKTCLEKYLLNPCPGEDCNNIISLNGFDELDDVEYYTCTSCDTIFCHNCIIRSTNIQLCKYCFYE
jgi:hypothetical protein